jgi:DNA-binding Xre family transcriptional regulator
VFIHYHQEVFTVKLKVKQILDSNHKSAYALWKASGLPRNTVYALTQGKTARLDLETLGRVLWGLERITGQYLTPNDLLEVSRDATP